MITSSDSNILRNAMSSLINRGRTGLVAVLVLAGACTDSTSPLQHEGRPGALEFSIGGFGAPSRQLEMRGDTVIARRRPYTWTPGVIIDSVRVVPSAEAWRAFWAA